MTICLCHGGCVRAPYPLLRAHRQTQPPVPHPPQTSTLRMPRGPAPGRRREPAPSAPRTFRPWDWPWGTHSTPRADRFGVRPPSLRSRLAGAAGMSPSGPGGPRRRCGCCRGPGLPDGAGAVCAVANTRGSRAVTAAWGRWDQCPGHVRGGAAPSQSRGGHGGGGGMQTPEPCLGVLGVAMCGTTTRRCFGPVPSPSNALLGLALKWSTGGASASVRSLPLFCGPSVQGHLTPSNGMPFAPGACCADLWDYTRLAPFGWRFHIALLCAAGLSLTNTFFFCCHGGHRAVVQISKSKDWEWRWGRRMRDRRCTGRSTSGRAEAAMAVRSRQPEAVHRGQQGTEGGEDGSQGGEQCNGKGEALEKSTTWVQGPRDNHLLLRSPYLLALSATRNSGASHGAMEKRHVSVRCMQTLGL